jgi:hypothetical protein
MSATQAGRRAAGFVPIKKISPRTLERTFDQGFPAKTDIRPASQVPFRVPLPTV